MPDIEAGYRIGKEKLICSLMSRLVDWSGMQTLQAPASVFVTVSVHCWINMLLAIAIFSVSFLGAVFMRGMILYDKGVCVTPEAKKD